MMPLKCSGLGPCAEVLNGRTKAITAMKPVAQLKILVLIEDPPNLRFKPSAVTSGAECSFQRRRSRRGCSWVSQTVQTVNAVNLRKRSDSHQGPTASLQEF